VNSYDVIQALQQGDFIAKEVVQRWHEDIATGLGSLLNVLDPSITVVGGGMAQVVDFDLLHQLTQQRAMYTPIKLVPAQLENKAGIVGAAYIALERTNPA
jgi:predicted NBD/HSP70 family sugar kinase